MAILKQNPGKALFSDIEWSKPENSNLLGKLLIVGGSAHSIAAPSSSYEIAAEFGVTNLKVIVPEAVKKNIPLSLPFLDFAESNPSGSFSKEATIAIMSYTQSSDCTIFCGNFGKNSETAILIENILSASTHITTMNGDAVDYFIEQPEKILERPNTITVASFAQLQKIAKNTDFTEAFLFNDGAQATINKLQIFMNNYSGILITEKEGFIILADQNNIVSTNFGKTPQDWQIKVSTTASCWAMTNKINLFNACATAIALKDQ